MTFTLSNTRLLAAALVVCLTAPPAFSQDGDSALSADNEAPALLLAAGNIGAARNTVNGLCMVANSAAATGALLDANPSGIVQTLGDNVTLGGRMASYTGCYDSTWGGENFDRTNPAAGDDEYESFDAGVDPPYKRYFGDKAGASNRFSTATTSRWTDHLHGTSSS